MILVLIMIGAMAYAQQTERAPNPTSAQVRQNAQQFLTQTRTNMAQFESNLDGFRAGSTSNRDAITFNRLKAEIENLESMITSEENRLRLVIDRGVNISQVMLNRLEGLISQHKEKTAELEAFISN
jgi:hypothetical protein